MVLSFGEEPVLLVVFLREADFVKGGVGLPTEHLCCEKFSFSFDNGG